MAESDVDIFDDVYSVEEVRAEGGEGKSTPQVGLKKKTFYLFSLSLGCRERPLKV